MCFVIGVRSACMSVNHMNAWYPLGTENGNKPPKTQVINDCKANKRVLGFWESNPGVLKEHLVILTAKQSL